MDNMRSEEYIGCTCPIQGLRAIVEQLNDKVVEKINDTQELVMVNDYVRETNENMFRKCLQDRMSEISSWRWVLEDLSKRLAEAVDCLKYEQKAVRTVVKRVTDEMTEQHQTKPGLLCPKVDAVEIALKEEYDFLRNQKKTFEQLLMVTEQQIAKLERTRTRIKNDILNKDDTLVLEETMSKINLKSLSATSIKKKKKKKPSTLTHWENRCAALKQEGLEALHDALLTKQQVRGSRVQLTIAAQSYENKVDSALKKRLHANHVKLQEIAWQKQETENDLKLLEEEQMKSEKSLLLNMEQERVIEARLADRSFRPGEELTKDPVDEKLKQELARVKRFIKDLQNNYSEIITLQNHLKEALTKMDCYEEDLLSVVKIDEARMETRLGESAPSVYVGPIPSSASYGSPSHSSASHGSPNHSSASHGSSIHTSELNRSATHSSESHGSSPPEVYVSTQAQNYLQTIQEEDEGVEGYDDYPFED